MPCQPASCRRSEYRQPEQAAPAPCQAGASMIARTGKYRAFAKAALPTTERLFACRGSNGPQPRRSPPLAAATRAVLAAAMHSCCEKPSTLLRGKTEQSPPAKEGFVKE